MFRDWVKADGSTRFTPDANRYVLYVSLACPWAHRTLITRRLKGLEDVVDCFVVHPLLRPGGWRFAKAEGKPEFDDNDPCASIDTLNGCQRMAERTLCGLDVLLLAGSSQPVAVCDVSVREGRPGLSRQHHGARAVGQERGNHREQRVLRGASPVASRVWLG